MFSACSILYVEDDALSRNVLDLVLRRSLGVERLTIWEDSTDFIERLRSLAQPPDLILLDIHMKPLTGFEMLAQLRAEAAYEKTPVIALTASVMNEEVDLLKTSGFRGVIGKPVDIDKLPGQLERALRGESVWAITGDDEDGLL